jgi:ribose transport system permease protein
MVAAVAPARPRARRMRAVSRNQGAIIAGVILVVLLVIYQAQAGKVLSTIQIRILLNGALALVWATIGLTFVVVAGGFDLSVGSLMSVANVLAATLLAGTATDPLVIVAILAVGGLAGLANGVLIAVVRIQSIIVTLAAMFIWSGVALLIMPQPGGVIPAYLSEVTGGSVGGVPVALVWLVVIFGAIAVFRQSSAWDVLFAVGGDEVGARRSGVRVTRGALVAYMAAGVCYAIAGLFLSAQSTGGDANIGTPFLLTSFAAVILGGTPLGGGRGTFVGAVLGALVVATLGSVLLSLGVTSYWTDVVQGTVLILAVVVPILVAQTVRRRAARDVS